MIANTFTVSLPQNVQDCSGIMNRTNIMEIQEDHNSTLAVFQRYGKSFKEFCGYKPAKELPQVRTDEMKGASRKDKKRQLIGEFVQQKRLKSKPDFLSDTVTFILDLVFNGLYNLLWNI